VTFGLDRILDGIDVLVRAERAGEPAERDDRGARG
jgi:hypothetical protein